MPGVEVLVGNLNKVGFFDFILPFILFTAIVYGILTTKKWISGESSVNGTIAILFAFSLLNYTPMGIWFSSLFGMASMILAVMLILLMFTGLAGLNMEDVVGSNKALLGMILGLLVVFMFWNAGGFGRSAGGGAVSETTVSMMILVLVMAVVVSYLGNK